MTRYRIDDAPRRKGVPTFQGIRVKKLFLIRECDRGPGAAAGSVGKGDVAAVGAEYVAGDRQA
jgi:hypothetical protein